MRHTIFFLLLLTACGTTPTGTTITDTFPDTTNIKTAAQNDTTNADSDAESNYATYFVLIADTGISYSTLHRQMFSLNKDLSIPIDTMDRYYNKTKDLIALPDTSDDEIYAGDYFPRRFPSEHLSLEYLNFYKKEAGNKTIALVAGIYEREKSADSALAVLRPSATKAFTIKTDIYIGCMH
ncbi:MAG: hypothetical protein KF744_00705 [Taibaiella sp.]|nr:hypothetical protein [Taibaiella sp.]